MKPMWLVLSLAILGIAGPAGSSSFAAGQENRPGYPTVGRVHVLNSARSEAVPVKIQDTGDVLSVSVAGTPTVTLLPTAVVGARQVRQAWEYRRIVFASGQDSTAALNAAGLDGWEAISATGEGSGVAWTLKRPK